MRLDLSLKTKAASKAEVPDFDKPRGVVNQNALKSPMIEVIELFSLNAVGANSKPQAIQMQRASNHSMGRGRGTVVGGAASPTCKMHREAITMFSDFPHSSWFKLCVVKSKDHRKQKRRKVAVSGQPLTGKRDGARMRAVLLQYGVTISITANSGQLSGLHAFHSHGLQI
jgi:hypothetical protein